MIIGATGAIADITSGLVAHYEFEGNALDSSGNGNNGAENGGVSYLAGKVGQAATFDGIDDYFQVSDNTQLRLSNTDFTISAWIYETARNESWGDAILAKRGSGFSNGWGLSVGGERGSTVADVIYKVSAGGDPDINSEGHIELNQWHHILLTYDYETQTAKVYIDGNLEDQGILPTPNSTTSSDLFIGKDSTADQYYFHGLMDDIRIYSRAINSSEIEEVHQYDGNGCTGTYTQNDLDVQYLAGKQYCINNSSACGISTGGTTVVSSEDDISIDITSGWQLAGASGAIAVSDFNSFFNSACVSEVYYFNSSWYHYVPGSSTSGLINIGPDQGFWINGKKSCTLSNLRYTEEQCNLGYPSFSASDKAWCDAQYY
ncbi:MAG: LamG domain-containing protein [Campylobacterota bacterium]|nr:LamG domain-containing protein [Campylobacterota bacterium]